MKILAFVLAAGVMLCGSLEAQQPLIILKAVYAAENVQRDVTPYLAAKVQNGQLQLRVGNDTLGGDPRPGKTKSLTVLYQTGSGEFSFTTQEGRTFVLPNSGAVPVAAENQASVNQNASTDSSQSIPATPAQRVPHRLAPAGTYYLLQHISVSTDSGVVGFPSGTQVNRIGESGETMMVKAGEQQFVVQKSMLTNDLDMASAAVNQAYQSEVAALAAQQAAAQAAQVHAEVKAAAEEIIKRSLLLDVIVVQVLDNGILARLPEVAGAKNQDFESGIRGKTVFIEGAKGSFADDDEITIHAFHDGVMSYTTALGAERTVEKWVSVPDSAFPKETPTPAPVEYSHGTMLDEPPHR